MIKCCLFVCPRHPKMVRFLELHNFLPGFKRNFKSLVLSPHRPSSGPSANIAGKILPKKIKKSTKTKTYTMRETFALSKLSFQFTFTDKATEIFGAFGQFFRSFENIFRPVFNTFLHFCDFLARFSMRTCSWGDKKSLLERWAVVVMPRREFRIIF